jgi:LytS/YehU family sensor histidine kinase
MAAGYATGLLLPLPLAVMSFNLAPVRGRSRAVWLFATAVAYALVAAALGPKTSEEMAFFAFAALITAVYEYRHRAAVSESDLMRAQIDSVALDAQLTRARLQLLRSQAEPHFLFNTLANVRTLARTDKKAAAAMIDNFMHYLGAALPSLRAEQLTLAEEGALVEAYLRIHKMRMGERLQYRVDIPSDLAGAPVPSMMLLTLVENSIKHGLAPLSEGGIIEIRARRIAQRIELSVADSGRGLQPTAGAGTGLANIRSRLTLLHGAGSTLSLAAARPRGLVATITFPAQGAA